MSEQRTPHQIAADLEQQAAQAEANCTPLASCAVVALTVEYMKSTADALDWIKGAIQRPPA